MAISQLKDQERELEAKQNETISTLKRHYHQQLAHYERYNSDIAQIEKELREDHLSLAKLAGTVSSIQVRDQHFQEQDEKLAKQLAEELQAVQKAQAAIGHLDAEYWEILQWYKKMMETEYKILSEDDHHGGFHHHKPFTYPSTNAIEAIENVSVGALVEKSQYKIDQMKNALASYISQEAKEFAASKQAHENSVQMID